jgi:uncharacterized protein YqgV (UPF0045/DUF77 family)
VPKKLKPIIVTVTDNALKNIDQLASKLKSQGMKVDRVMPMTGVISGSFDVSKMSALKDLEGVMSVEEEVSAELPPPDSPVQ